MNAMSIGLSALSVGQRGLDLVGQNLANATTPGYHRQALNLVNRVTDNTIGDGVDVATITRYTADPVRTAILTGNSAQAYDNARLDIRQQLQSTLGTGTGGIGDQLNNFFNQVSQLTATPDNAAARRPVIAAASALAQQLNSAAGSIDQLRANVGAQVPTDISNLNKYAQQIAQFNLKIASAEQAGTQPNDLLDQRSQVIDQLSQLINIKTVNQPDGVVNVIADSAPVVVGQTASSFQVAASGPGGALVVTQTGSAQPVTFSSGSLGGKLQEYNTDIPATRARLDALAGQLISKANEVQATGIGLNGPITSTTGTVSAFSATAPLNAAGLPFPVQAGQLTVSVTDATGNRTNSTINIDPTTDTLTSLATKVGAVPGLTASVSASNTLQIQAQAGFSFDFAGRDTNPPGAGAVSNPDTANVLSALGVNGLFTGTDAASIGVQPAIVADPNLLAGSRSGQPGDATNLENLVAVGTQALIGGRTLSDDYADQASSVGTDVKTLNDNSTAQAGVMQNLSNQEQSVTGVDQNEELVNLMNYQQMVEGASKYISVVNSSVEQIINIIK
jgi:flagellar hook-associated protein FlgK